MEVVILCITLTLMMAVCLVAVGYLIGSKSNDKGINGIDYKDVGKGKYVLDSSDLSDARSGDSSRSGNSVDLGRMDANRAKIALKKIRKSYERSESERNDAIDYAINCINAIQEIKEYIKREKDHG